ncbi:MAG: AraC family transcriptional regulator [Spirochaetota bacterium]
MNARTLSQLSMNIDVRPQYSGYPHHLPGWSEERVHPVFDLWVITHGAVMVTMKDRTETLHPGDVYLIPPHTPYAAGSRSAAALQYMHFDCVLGDNRSFLSASLLAGKYPAASIRAEREIYSNAFMLNREGASMAGLALRGALSMLISRMMALRLHGKRDDMRSGREFERIHPVLDHIAWHADEHIANNTLADIAGMTGSYFIRYFRRVMGVTPKRYIERMKMERAKEMLLERTRNIREIAAALHFPDQFSFSKAFKKMYERSPSEYLKEHSPRK